MDRLTCDLRESARGVSTEKPAGSEDGVPDWNVTSPMPVCCPVVLLSNVPMTSVAPRGAAPVCWLPVVVPPSKVPSSTRPDTVGPARMPSWPPAAPSV